VLTRIRCALSLAAATALAWLAGCDARQSVAQGGAAALTRNLAHVRSVEIHVEEPWAAEPLRRLAALERARSGRDVRVLVQSTGDPDAARIVIGTTRSGAAAVLAARAGLAIQPGERARFRAGNFDHDAPEDAACATFADPDRPGLPVTVWLGNDLERLLPQIEDLIPRSSPTLRTWRGGDPVLQGKLSQSGAVVPREIHRVGLARIALRGAVAPLPESDGFRVEVAPGIEAGTAARLLRELEAARERATSWAGAPSPRVTVRLLALVEDLRLGGEQNRLGRWNRARPAADMLVVAGISDGGAAAVRAGLRATLGPAVVPWIEEGASVAASRSWFGRELDRWLARLATAGAMPRLAAILEPGVDARISAHVLAPARAALFEHLLATRGPEFMRGLWGGTRALDVDEDLEKSFAASLSARAAPYVEEVARLGELRRASILAAPPIAGVAFVESDSDPRSGYGSKRALDSVRSLSARGTRSIALDAIFVRTEIENGWPVPRALSPQCGDVALFATASAARDAGLRVALFPSVLASDAGTYRGGWSRNLESEWAAYFDEHARAIEHAGLLANLCSIDWLTVGSAIRAISGAGDERRSRPEEGAWKRDGWRRVIGVARGAFSGALTYGATDLPEVEKIAFWGDLDAIGLELDPRLEPGSADPRSEIEHKLRHALEGVGRFAQSSGRPVVLTHVSFAPVLDGAPSVKGDWTSAQIQILAGVIQSTTAAGHVDVRAAWLARVGSDPADPGRNARDPLLRAESNSALGDFFAASAGWIREESR